MPKGCTPSLTSQLTLTNFLNVQSTLNTRDITLYLGFFFLIPKRGSEEPTKYEKISSLYVI